MSSKMLTPQQAQQVLSKSHLPNSPDVLLALFGDLHNDTLPHTTFGHIASKLLENIYYVLDGKLELAMQALNDIGIPRTPDIPNDGQRMLIYDLSLKIVPKLIREAYNAELRTVENMVEEFNAKISNHSELRDTGRISWETLIEKFSDKSLWRYRPLTEEEVGNLLLEAKYFIRQDEDLEDGQQVTLSQSHLDQLFCSVPGLLLSSLRDDSSDREKNFRSNLKSMLWTSHELVAEVRNDLRPSLERIYKVPKGYRYREY